MREVVTVVCVPTAHISNPARDDPARLCLKSYGGGSTVSFEHGQVADLIIFGYVQRSELVHGRTYRSRAGNGSRMVKEIEIVLVAQEGERALAFLSTVTEGKHVTLPVTPDGGLTFSTKHTVFDERDPALKRRTFPILYETADYSLLLAGKKGDYFKNAPLPRSSRRDVVHKEIVRRPREGTEAGKALSVSASRASESFCSSGLQLTAPLPSRSRASGRTAILSRADFDPT